MEKFFAVNPLTSHYPTRIFTYTPQVSQFTLLAVTKKGSKPDFHGALGGEKAKELYQLFVEKVQKGYAAERVKDGVFQAMMV
jgi:D-Tyr-tRNAtyr deacylase